MHSLMYKGRSSSWSNGDAKTDFNLARGLRAVYYGSAFLPAFVIEGLFSKFS